jgi:hypothetical protein
VASLVNPADNVFTSGKYGKYSAPQAIIETAVGTNATAEYLRKAFEKHGLAPASDVATHLDMPADLPGRDKLA